MLFVAVKFSCAGTCSC